VQAASKTGKLLTKTLFLEVEKFDNYRYIIVIVSQKTAHFFKEKTQNISLKLPKAILSTDRNTQHAIIHIM